MKTTHFFPVVVHYHDEAGPLKQMNIEATSPNEAIEKAVYAHGNTSAYEIRIQPRHTWVLQRQKELWKREEYDE